MRLGIERALGSPALEPELERGLADAIPAPDLRTPELAGFTVGDDTLTQIDRVGAGHGRRRRGERTPPANANSEPVSTLLYVRPRSSHTVSSIYTSAELRRLCGCEHTGVTIRFLGQARTKDLNNAALAACGGIKPVQIRASEKRCDCRLRCFDVP